MKFLRPATVLVAFSAASCDDPGEGKAARAGYQYCSVVISSLETYRGENGRYPDSLEQLPPRADIGKLPAEIDAVDYWLESGEGYALAFVYQGPGRNICTFESRTKAWSCIGYY